MKPRPSSDLQAARDEVDNLSLAILDLLSARGRCALGILRVKDEHKLPLRDLHREAQHIEWLVRQNHGPFDDQSIRTIFRAIIDASVALMEREGASNTAARVSAQS